MVRWKTAASIVGAVALLLGGIWLLVGTGNGGARSTAMPSNLPPQVTTFISRLSPQAREAYLFALERPDILQYIPCYCGCSAMSHDSNLVCFVKSRSGSEIELETHGST